MPPDITAIMQRAETLKMIKFPWLPLYQSLAMYILLRKQYFTIDHLKSPFLLNHVWDNTAGHAVHMSSASVLGQVMPNPYESFEFAPQVAQQESVYGDTFDFFKTVNQVMPTNLDLPKAGLMNALMECIIDLFIFGIGAIVVEECDDFATPIRFFSADAKVMSIDEDQYGNVDTVYLEKELSVVKIIEKYGYDNCSEAIRKAYDAKAFDEKHKVLHAIEPRRERNPLKLGTLDMPWSSVHIETETKHLLRESGYRELPVIVCRFWKNVSEMQGRSPAMDALPDIRALNSLVELFEKAGEMGLDPPKMIATEDILGAGKIPWGPGVDIPIHSSGRLGTGGKGAPPIELIQVVENPSWAIQRIQDLREQVQQYFLTQALLNPLGTYRKTLGEANIENDRNTYAIGPMLNRMLVELLGPSLDRSFNILLGKGYFGVVRGSVQDVRQQMMGLKPKYLSQDFITQRMVGAKGYRINFICPAAKLMKMSEGQGTAEFVQEAMQIGQINPQAMDVANWDEIMKVNQRTGGASSKIINSPDVIDQIRKGRAQQQAAQQKMQEGLALAKMAKESGSGASDWQDAINPQAQGAA